MYNIAAILAEHDTSKVIKLIHNKIKHKWSKKHSITLNTSWEIQHYTELDAPSHSYAALICFWLQWGPARIHVHFPYAYIHKNIGKCART